MVQLETPAVAAHEIRDRLEGGRAIDDLVPAGVMDYIRLHHLYGAGRDRRQLG
jgi:nicotinic acid mononucleotide adenylyltransferase